MALSEKRREYLRMWRAKNRDKLREQQKNAIRNKALRALKSTSVENVQMVIVRSFDGGEYVVGRRV